MITGETAKKIFDAEDRTQKEKIRKHFEGKSIPQELYRRRIDGREKSKNITNWTKYVANLHVGFATSNDVNYTLNGLRQDDPGLSNFEEVSQLNNLAALDSDHYRFAFLYGYSVETYSFDGITVKVTITNPNNWSFVKNENGDIVEAIYGVLLKANTYYKEDLLDKDTLLLYVYDKEEVKVFIEDNKKKELIEVESYNHQFDGLPLTVFKIKRDGQPFLDDDFFSLVDDYNISRSSLSDEIKYAADSLLKMTGTDKKHWESLLEKDETGVTSLQKLTEMGFLPVPQGGDADYLTRSTSVEKYEFGLRSTRASIHTAGCIPDLTHTRIDVNGAITNISGIALKLMFAPLEMKAGEFAKVFEVSLRERVNHINSVFRKLNQATLEDYDLKLQLNIPQNHTDWLQYLSNMKDVIPIKEIYRLMPFIEYPERVYGEFLQEKDTRPPQVTEMTSSVDNENPL